MKFISLFSGIGGFDLGLERAGMKCVAQVENDKQALAVLERHWPKVKRFDDVGTFQKKRGLSADLICGGFPCQDLSVAGKRAGLAGKRSGLFFEFMRIVGDFAPKWVLIENVPGLLSGCGCPLCGVVAERLRKHHAAWEKKLEKDDDPYLPARCECGECEIGRELHQAHSGRNLAIVLSSLVERGYGWAYRILDSQYFGLAQRRDRVFIVGHLGDARRAAEVLFESESLPWNPPPSRKAGEEVAPTFRNGTDSGSNEHGNKVAHTHTHTATDMPGAKFGALDRGLL